MKQVGVHSRSFRQFGEEWTRTEEVEILITGYFERTLPVKKEKNCSGGVPRCSHVTATDCIIINRLFHF